MPNISNHRPEIDFECLDLGIIDIKQPFIADVSPDAATLGTRGCDEYQTKRKPFSHSMTTSS